MVCVKLGIAAIFFTLESWTGAVTMLCRSKDEDVLSLTTCHDSVWPLHVLDQWLVRWLLRFGSLVTSCGQVGRL